MSDQKVIRVLIVDDIAETRENIRRSLQFDSSILIIGLAQSGEEGIQLAKEKKPDVIIMDINMPDMDGITATEAIRKAVPATQVVILSVQGDPHYMRKAMLVGARDFLTKPPSIDELITAIHRAGEMAIEFREIERQEAEKRAALEATQNELREPGSTITIYSPKGGVGSTTLATNLAISMLTDGKKVILIDGNTQYGDVSVFMNVQARTFLADLVSRADELDDDIVTDVISIHAETGLHILAAPPGPDIADKLTGEQFTKTIEFLRKKYNYIIIDTMPYLSEIVQASLVEADAIVLITSQDIPSVKSSSMFLNLADATGIERKRILFVMNHFDKRLGISPERIGESLKQEIVLTIPYDERLLVSASVNKGIPLMVDSKAHPFCKSIGALGARITERLEELKKTA